MNGEKVMGLGGDVRGLFQDSRYSRVGDETFERNSKWYPPY
jgi:hypothetical protein